MTDITALAKRLRVLAKCQMGMGTSEPEDHIAWEAADALEAQAKETEKQKHFFALAEKHRDELDARIAELEAALKPFAEIRIRPGMKWLGDTGMYCIASRDICAARAALKGEKK